MSLLMSVCASAGAVNAQAATASAMLHGYANMTCPPTGCFAICGVRKISAGRRSDIAFVLDHHTYWITSSAVICSVSGNSRPSALAVLRLMTN
jgi:hypothetical protein